MRSSKMLFIFVICFSMLAGCGGAKGGSALPKILKAGNTYEIGYMGRNNAKYEILDLDDSGWVKTNSSRYGTEWLNVGQFAMEIKE